MSQSSICEKPGMTGRAWPTLIFVPVGAATLLIIVANLFFICFRLGLPYPISPWEAGIVTDAWRMLRGDGVYALGVDHATHMYGPLTTMLLAQAFRFTGPMLQI